MERVMKNNLFIISPYGYKYIASTLFAAFVFALLDLELFSLVAFLLALFFVYSFRNPERELSFLDPKAVVSPVDGVVKTIDEIDDAQYGYKVTIESNYLHVGVLRVPISANLKALNILKGARTSKNSKLFYDLNEMAELVFTYENENSVKVIHRLKQTFAPLSVEITQNNTVHKGSRYGYALNSVTELYLPKNFRLDIKPSREIKASHSLIGYFS
ncbi:MAG TPA: phosphatidylserine decarboxylase [Sulfurimonas autotrophica]|nr:phosphatidylserine decarboxylase [Sulfurimonas autotrophica]